MEPPFPVFLADEFDQLVVDVSSFGFEETGARTQLVEEEKVLQNENFVSKLFQVFKAAWVKFQTVFSSSAVFI